MPKIEVNEKLFFNAIGKKYTYAELEDVFPCAKAELDAKNWRWLKSNLASLIRLAV